jgi:hypothetical protein
MNNAIMEVREEEEEAMKVVLDGVEASVSLPMNFGAVNDFGRGC